MTHRARELGLTARRLLMFLFGVAAGGLVVVGAPASAVAGQCIRDAAGFGQGGICSAGDVSIASIKVLGTCVGGTQNGATCIVSDNTDPCIVGGGTCPGTRKCVANQLITVNGSYVLGLVVLTALQVLSISIHEAGHALAIRHFGRRVRRFGLAMYYLFPCAYVDATDMSLGSRWQRVIVSLSGPFAGATVAAACAIVAAATPGTLVGELGFKAASLLVFQFFLNLVQLEQQKFVFLRKFARFGLQLADFSLMAGTSRCFV